MRPALLAALLLLPRQLLGWGNEGHSITALVAQDLLKSDPSEEARRTLAAVGAILAGTPIDQAALWPDEVKNDSRACAQAPYLPDPKYKNPKSSAICDAYRATAAWHFINTDAPVYQERKGSVDTVVMIRLLTYLLRGDKQTGAPPPASFSAWKAQCLKKPDHPCKKEALEFLIHLVGDIHQPLHSGSACDAGGNSQYIIFFGETTDPAAVWCGPNDPPECKNHELHQAWDASMILRQYESNETYASGLVAQFASTQAPSGLPADWANESIRLIPQAYTFPDDGGPPGRCLKQRAVKTARGTAYKAVRVGLQYYEANIGTVRERLFWGGARLASMLKAVYGEGDKARE